MNFFSGQTFTMGGNSPQDRFHQHRIPLYYGIQYNHAGPVLLRIDDGPIFRADGPHVFFTHPGAFFDYSPPPGMKRHHMFICTEGERIRKYIESGLMDLSADSPLVPVPDPARLYLSMRQLLELIRQDTAAPRAVLLFEEILLQIHEARTKNGKRKLPPFQENILRDLADRIRRNPEKTFDFDREAVRCGVSPAHFRRLFKGENGLPPLQFLLKCRLALAAEQLLTSSCSVFEAGAACGIPNQYYFSRLFKEHYRLSPIEYRREFRGT